MPTTSRKVVAVVGPSRPTPKEAEAARKAGEMVARAGLILATGGLGGCMEEASRGAADAGGLVVGLLPRGPEEANPFVHIPLGTGLGEMRNFVLVKVAAGVVAVGRSPGTLSEVAMAVRLGKPTVAFGCSFPELGLRELAEDELRDFLNRIARTP